MNNDNKRSNMKQILAVIERGEGTVTKNYWTRIGVAFENRDGSWNLRFDFFPTNPVATTIQLRDFEPREGEREREPEHE
jgi:hypothetical protein